MSFPLTFLMALAFSGTSLTFTLEVIQAPEKLERCVYGNQTYTTGERFRPDPCTACHCPRHGGRVLCTIQDCLWEPHCLRRHKRPDECCGSCLEQGCLHSDGKVYAPGATVFENSCEKCVCPREGGPTRCTKTFTCQEGLNCVDSVIDPGTCCPKCPNGENCWLGKRIIKAGVVVNVGRCKSCECPDPRLLPYWRKASGSHAICTARPC